jgi:hypothetical protein
MQKQGTARRVNYTHTPVVEVLEISTGANLKGNINFTLVICCAFSERKSIGF